MRRYINKEEWKQEVSKGKDGQATGTVCRVTGSGRCVADRVMVTSAGLK
jgi:hypothetical protein